MKTMSIVINMPTTKSISSVWNALGGFSFNLSMDRHYKNTDEANNCANDTDNLNDNEIGNFNSCKKKDADTQNEHRNHHLWIDFLASDEHENGGDNLYHTYNSLKISAFLRNIIENAKTNNGNQSSGIVTCRWNDHDRYYRWNSENDYESRNNLSSSLQIRI